MGFLFVTSDLTASLGRGGTEAAAAPADPDCWGLNEILSGEAAWRSAESKFS